MGWISLSFRPVRSSCPCFVRKSAAFLSEASFEYFSSQLLFAWILFSRVNTQVCTERIPVLVSKAAPDALWGSGHVAEGEAVGFACSGRLKEHEA